MREQPQDNLQDLRLVGVHDDGQHLLLSANSGELFRLRLDEALRRAVARPAPQRPMLSDGATMSPRQIQAEIRAGATAESIAESSGIPLDRVRRYESPVLAEREHIARLAQAAEIGPPPPTHSAFAAEFGTGPARLGDMVSHRLAVHGIDPSTVEWDSWRRRDGMWTVVARFTLPEGAPASIGEEPPAMWTFNPVRRGVTNANRWAQQLSELEPLDGPISPRRLSVVDRPFDVEAAPEPLPEPRDAESELLDMLRARRGQRLGVDENGDDALALLLTQGIPAAHPRPAETPAERQRQGEERDSEPQRQRRLEPVRDAASSRFPDPTLNDDGPGREDSHLRLAPGLGSATREITIVPRPTPQPAAPTEDRSGVTPREDAEKPTPPTAPDEAPSEAVQPDVADGSKAEQERPSLGAPEPTRRSSRPKRSSIPSWDEIVFGTKSE
ncbi:septation protein SepH [Sinomonas gamaensis]|uniref:septation protein SepH n=1 Tax=Sinomonas gamaensis TaxID=2565624 RepID=UPI0020163896|nr:septation protein SepH [Sinomonas gamaensis]